MTARPMLMVEFATDDGTKVARTLRGRDAETLAMLIAVGIRGCTTADFAAGLRVSAYIKNLRDMGLVIEKVNERHSGSCPGYHGRYVLHSGVRIIAFQAN